jgi:cytochrome c553
MIARRFASRLSLIACALLASASLLTATGCKAAKLPEKHPTVSAEKAKTGCGSCHREAPAIKNASD